MKISLLGLVLLFLSYSADAQIKLAKQSFLKGKLELLIPADFKPMSQEMINAKYPNRTQQPDAVLTDADGTVNVIISYLPQHIEATQMTQFKDFQLNNLKKSRPDGEWQGDGVKKVNGKNVGYIKFMIKAVDQKVFNYMFFTNLDGRVLLMNFNCTETLLPDWKDAAESIVSSVVTK